MKKLTSILLGGLLALAQAGGAIAAPPAAGTAVEINIYGASAQYLFWNDLADDWMKENVSPGANCSDATVDRGIIGTTHGVTWGSACANVINTPPVVVRYTSKNSCGGLQAVSCINDPTDPCSVANPCDRTLVNEQLCPGGGATCTGTQCVDVTHGASDVESTSLVQVSQGELKGRCGGAIVNKGACGAFPTGKTYNPTVVPFGFFLNDAVKQGLCNQPGDIQHGQPCDVNAVRNPTAKCADGAGSCVAGEVQDLSRMMIAMIYSVQAFSWTDFGGSFTAIPIEACLRHSGSGTHATFDLAVMKNAATMVTFEIPSAAGYGLPAGSAPASQYAVWFNEGSSDMMRCVNGNWMTASPGTCSAAGQEIGAIGYADADQGNLPFTYGPVAYNGYKPLAQNIRWGLYDNFWSTQWIYEDCTNPRTVRTVAECQDAAAKLMAYAATKIPASKSEFWNPLSAMNYMKTHDYTYPGYVGTLTPIYP